MKKKQKTKTKKLKVKAGVSTLKTRTIHVDTLARVEGEGALYVKMRGNKVEDVQLKIFEPPRFFEAFLRGRAYSEAPDITARICGICPIAYQMSAVHAVENAFGVKINPAIRELRRLIYCGEWMESHTLHVYMLHAPDFLGYEDAIRMAKDHPREVERGLQLKKVGNEIVKLFGGREIHPINVKVGGFYKLPSKTDAAALCERLKWARDVALETVRWVARFPFPDFEIDYEFVSLSHPKEYPMNEGRLVSSRGLDIDAREYEDHFEEIHVAYTNALHSVLKTRDEYFVGPLARYSLNADRLSPWAVSAAKEIGFPRICRNPFKSIIARSLEILHACDEAIRILTTYDPAAKGAVDITARPGTGYACTEAPRGILYHRYKIGEDGLIQDAKIVPPTSQNQKTIESDLRQLVEKSPMLSQEKLTWRCEQAIRNYDPCISCATHFLKLEINHE
jgi:coenzyme F420-reducing hydrogenase alpha subunit